MKRYFYYLTRLVLSITCTVLLAQNEPFKDTRLPIETRVNDLLQRMTLAEKVQLLVSSTDTNFIGDKTVGWMGFMDNQNPPEVTAANYNKLVRYFKNKTKYGLVGLRTAEGIFAYMGYGSTAFPQPLAQAASWDPSVVISVAGVLANEIKPRGVRLLFSPVLNMGRDPRWGRTGETYGEDPYLVSRMGVAYIKTMEQNGIATTMKHFAGNTGHDGKFGVPVFYSERYYREFEFPPYEAAVKEGKTQAVMMAYNTGDAIPFAQNAWMMQKYLKQELDFKGVIMSDGGGLQLIDEVFGIDTADVEIVAKCINAGCDWALDNPKYYKKALLAAVAKGLVSESTITESARRTLRIHFSTGLYDNPYADPKQAKAMNDCEAHRNTALQVALKSTVLLKNEANTLPFSKNIKSVLVAGQLGNRLLINHYGGWGRKEITVLEGIQNLLPNSKIVYKQGARVGYTFFPTIPAERLFHIRDGKTVSGMLAAYYNNNRLMGVPAFTQVDSVIDFDWKNSAPNGLPSDDFSVLWQGYFIAPYSGVYTFGSNTDDGLDVYIDDKSIMQVSDGPECAIFIRRATIRLEKGKRYALKVAFKEAGGAAFAQLGWDADLYRYIPDAVAAAQKADAIVMVAGMYDDENGDRAILNLDEAQEALILALAKLEKPMVVVLQSGNVITMRRWADKVPAIVHAWYPGEEGGNAIAKILFGDYNPGAKLPITIPIETGQVPLTYNRFPGKDSKPVDRGLDRYVDVGNEPMFCFGHGLSYTRFEYSNIRISKKHITANDSVLVQCTVKNIGAVAGDEVVQLYIHRILASVSRPIKELKGFERISLLPGQSKEVQIVLKSEALKFYNSEMKKVFEPGYVEVMVGASSNDIKHTMLLQCGDR